MLGIIKSMPESLFQQALELHRQGQFDAAEKCYREILQQQPENCDALHGLGVLAQKHLQNAVKAQPNNPMFHNSLGNLWLRLGNFEQAEKSFSQALKLDDKHIPALNNLGNCYYQQNKFSDAQKTYAKVIQLAPNFADAHYNYAVVSAQLNNSEAAIAHFQKTIKLDPKHAPAYGQLGHLLLLNGEHEKAIEPLQKRLQLEPNYIDSLYDLGICYLKAKKYDTAIKNLEKTLELNPEHPDCHYNLATAYYQNADFDQAQKNYLRQINQNPHLESYYNVGVIMMYKDRHRDAIDYLQQCLSINPNYLPAHHNLAAIYLRIGDKNSALIHYQKILDTNPDDLEIKHIMSALKQEETPEQAPKEYIENLFDQYAGHYDTHLNQYLHYKVPEALLKALDEELDLVENTWQILDLGCGTGLTGELLKPYAQKLIGIDLSKKMLEIARQKACYDELQALDVSDALKRYQQQDLIVAADVFTYIGKLDTIIELCQKALKDNGVLAFSVEKTHDAPYKLQTTIRYAHERKYLENLLQKNNLKILKFDNIVLRQQQQKPVEGYLVVAANQHD